MKLSGNLEKLHFRSIPLIPGYFPVILVLYENAIFTRWSFVCSGHFVDFDLFIYFYLIGCSDEIQKNGSGTFADTVGCNVFVACSGCSVSIDGNCGEN